MCTKLYWCIPVSAYLLEQKMLENLAVFTCKISLSFYDYKELFSDAQLLNLFNLIFEMCCYKK